MYRCTVIEKRSPLKGHTNENFSGSDFGVLYFFFVSYAQILKFCLLIGPLCGGGGGTIEKKSKLMRFHIFFWQQCSPIPKTVEFLELKYNVLNQISKFSEELEFYL
jgi:hypothetical protein